MFFTEGNAFVVSYLRELLFFLKIAKFISMSFISTSKLSLLHDLAFEYN